MNKNHKETALPSGKCAASTIETVEMTEIDGMGQGAILRFTDVGKHGCPSQDKELRTCYGDIYVIINALHDYANLLESAIQEWSLAEYHAAIFELHAARCRKIAAKYAMAIGYDYDKAVERCRNRQAKGGSSNRGMDGLEAFACKDELKPKKKGKRE